ncbi:MAG: tetratricopeptide repeat protein [Bacteroidota bacterium]
MPKKTDKPLNFWQEMKRRKVVRVIIGYLASSYVLLELISIISEPFRLPEWTLRFVFILLCIGFVITVVISWIYDLTPQGIKKTESSKSLKEKAQPEPKKRKIKANDIIIGVLLVAVIILAYPKIFNKNNFRDVRDEEGKISVAVFPFLNLTNDTIWNVWQEGIPYNLINSLSNARELDVPTFQTMYDMIYTKNQTNYASLTSSLAGDLSQKLDASVYITGSIVKSGDKFRINAQLVKTKSGKIYQNFQVEGNSESDILDVTDSLSQLIRNFLQIEVMARNNEFKSLIRTKNPYAYRYLMIGMKQFLARDWKSAIESFTKVSEIDSNMIIQYANLIAAYNNSGQYEKGRQVFNKLYEHIDDKDLSDVDRLIIKVRKAHIDKNQTERIKYSILLTEHDPKLRANWYNLGWSYYNYRQYEKAISAFEKVLELNRQFGKPYEWIPTYTFLGRSYHKVGNHEREKEIYEIGLEIDSEAHDIISLQAICALSLGDTTEASGYLTRYCNLMKEKGRADHEILNRLGNIYWNADISEKAEHYYREALELEPDNNIYKSNLARLLIEEDINIVIGLELVNQLLLLRPDYYAYQYTKAIGLYKTGRLKEALSLFEDSWDRRPSYYHEHYLLIQEVKQALAKQNND